jgi:hypothetical protein
MALQDKERTNAAVFELERFEWATADRIELVGTWSGLRARRFIRPTLVLQGEGEPRRLLASLEHKPWPAVDGDAWVAAFECPGGPLKFRDAQLNVAPGIDLTLPPPRLRPGKPRRFKPRIPSHDAARDVDQTQRLLASPGIVTEPVEPRDNAATSKAASKKSPSAPNKGADREATPAKSASAPSKAVSDERESAATEAAPAPTATEAAAATPDLSADLDRVRAERDRMRDERDDALRQLREVRADFEAERQARERTVADARALERDKATAMLSEGAQLRASVERQREIAYVERDDAFAARDKAVEERDKALVERDAAVAARKEAERERNRAFGDRDHAFKERDRALAAQEKAAAERNAALEERDRADRERAEIVSLHERDLPLREPQPKFMPEAPVRDTAVDVWWPRAAALTILAIVLIIVIHLFGSF